MKNLKEIIKYTIILLVGIVFSKILEKILEKNYLFKISNIELFNYAFPVALFLLFALIFWYVIYSSNIINHQKETIEKSNQLYYKLLQDKLTEFDKLGTLVEYEETDGIWGTDREINFYDAKNSPIANAKSEVLMVIDSTAKTTIGNKDTLKRQEYLRAIEKNIINKAKEGFQYIRITQYPKGNNTPQSSNVTREHWRNLMKIKEEFKTNRNLEIELMKVEAERDFSFIIIDNKILEFEVVAVQTIPDTQQLVKYVLGYLTITDKKGDLIKIFRRYFEKMQRKAVLLDSNDLKNI